MRKEFLEKKCYWEPNTGCWLYFNGTDYGPIRKVYELFKGPIPKGLMICHHCDTPACVNPNHLYAGTRSQNMKDMVARNRRGLNGRVINERKTHCPAGHPYDEINTLHDKGRRRCKTCRVGWRSAYLERIKFQNRSGSEPSR